MTDQEHGRIDQDDPETTQAERVTRIQDDAARLGLAMVGEATAMTTGDEDAFRASEENLREVVAELVDEPLTPRQEQVVETLGAMGGSLTAGLGSALAQEQDREPTEVLGGAAASIVWQQRLADVEQDVDDIEDVEDR
ncbi:hypothetical protein [Curtobacterium sp. MCBD17_003]|uniref:hypothetical protein n=1 Tax=Curtobacterium sp. MCBD17_003 TaxID=2175667 RepID=UPI000DA6ED19|nr:hypothetical protein [Curtobacterium sp. MCBD17_003]WIE55047.1 hypothetical protein DEI88_002235 [Curtobacterium sp. MCBD17_003]